MGMYRNFGLIVLCIHLFGQLVNARFVHRKSRVPGVTRKLKGFIRSDPIFDEKGDETDFRRIADIETKLFSDVVVHDETEEEDFRIINCRYLWKRGYYDVVIKGKDADKTDFDAGTKYIIRRKTWLELCPKARLPPRADSVFEKYLFFNIISCTQKSRRKLMLAMVPTKRRKAIGKVRYSIRNEVFNKRDILKRVNFERNDDDITVTVDSAVSSNQSILLSSRVSASLSIDESETFAIATGVTATVSFDASVGIENLGGEFDVGLTGASIGISFETFLTASASAKLAIGAKELLEYTDEIFSVPIPSLSYSVSIPFSDDLSVGAFFALDFVASLEAELLATYTASVDFEKRVKVSFDLVPDTSASAEVIERSGSGSSALETASDAELGAKIIGFVGVKPAVGLEIDLGGVGSGTADVSIQAGLEASIEASDTPFAAVTSGTTFGVCEECHFVQGGISVVGRDLAFEYDVFGETDSMVLDSVSFDAPIGTVCAIPGTCV